MDVIKQEPFKPLSLKNVRFRVGNINMQMTSNQVNRKARGRHNENKIKELLSGACVELSVSVSFSYLLLSFI